MLETTPLLQLNPAIPGVFGGPYPFGIDPVRALTLLSINNVLCVNRKKSAFPVHCERLPQPSHSFSKLFISVGNNKINSVPMRRYIQDRETCRPSSLVILFLLPPITLLLTLLGMFDTKLACVPH